MMARAQNSAVWLGLVVLSCLASPVSAAAADPPRFDLPVDCEMGRECNIQNYVDQEPGSGARDFTCGLLTYNGHDGTDFRVPDYVAMERGVAVIAAAPGVVVRLRDGMRDVSVREIGKAALKDQLAGNAVVIDHGDGWETQYSHLREDSIVVRRGEQVVAGQPLGLIGLSGNTEFPHVHFEIRHDGKELDPFTGAADETGCGIAGRSLWSEAALKQLPYRPTGLLSAGFAPTPAKPEAARHGAYAATALPVDSAALVFWVDLFGVQAGDEETIRLLGPDGAELANVKRTIPKSGAVAFRSVGKKRKSAWAPGLYHAEYRLTRLVEGARRTVIETTREIELR